MTPQEKAKEFIEKYQSIAVTVVGCGDRNPCIVNNIMLTKSAAQCALVTVDEILSLCWGGNKVAEDYWQEVKKEIENL
jgi:hypothetical protein